MRMRTATWTPKPAKRLGRERSCDGNYKTPLIVSLKEVRRLLISHDEGVINDEEFLL